MIRGVWIFLMSEVPLDHVGAPRVFGRVSLFARYVY